MCAFKEGVIEVAEILVKNGANVNVCANNGESLLHVVLERGNLKFAKLLREHGATDLIYHDMMLLCRFVQKQQHDLAQILLDCGIIETYGRYLIVEVLYKKEWYMVDYLVEHGVEIPREIQYNIIQEYKKHCLEVLWEMDSDLFTNYFQWFPKEVAEDVSLLI